MCSVDLRLLRSVKLCVFIAVFSLAGGFATSAAAEERGPLAFDDRFQFRLASYSVRGADTDIAIADRDSGIGVAYSFSDDLGGDDNTTIPRIDAYYRFNDRHRIDFSHFRIDRSGREVLLLEVEFDDDTFSIGDTLVSDINYELFKLAYSYSLYRSSEVEIGVGAGLNITTYEFEYELADGSEGDTVDATGPLPMFNFRVSWALTHNWSLHYLTEAFYIELDDEFKGSFTTGEIDLEYRFSKYVILGAGITRFAIDLEANDDDWKGGITDTHRGFLAYISFFL